MLDDDPWLGGRNVRQDDVDEQVSAAAALEEDSKRRQQDGEDDLDDVAVRRLLARVARLEREKEWQC